MKREGLKSSSASHYTLYSKSVLWHEKSDDSHDTSGVSFQKFKLNVVYFFK